MVQVTIVKPTITAAEEKKVFEGIAYVLEKIANKEFGGMTKITITRNIS